MVPVLLFLASHSLTTTDAQAEPAPKRWCPHACPAMLSLYFSLYGEAVCARPGNASNSPKIPITGDPSPYSAMNAVGILATFSSILNPSLARLSLSKLEL